MGPALRARSARPGPRARLTRPPPPQVKRLERSGMSQAQAEELTAHICEVVAGTLERLEAKFATKTEAERVRRRRRRLLAEWSRSRAVPACADDIPARNGVQHVQGEHAD